MPHRLTDWGRFSIYEYSHHSQFGTIRFNCLERLATLTDRARDTQSNELNPLVGFIPIWRQLRMRAIKRPRNRLANWFYYREHDEEEKRFFFILAKNPFGCLSSYNERDTTVDYFRSAVKYQHRRLCRHVCEQRHDDSAFYVCTAISYPKQSEVRTHSRFHTNTLSHTPRHSLFIVQK